jgi:hypothetical protein
MRENTVPGSNRMEPLEKWDHGYTVGFLGIKPVNVVCTGKSFCAGNYLKKRKKINMCA